MEGDDIANRRGRSARTLAGRRFVMIGEVAEEIVRKLRRRVAREQQPAPAAALAALGDKAGGADEDR